MLLEAFCVARDDRRTAQSFKTGNWTGMSCGLQGCVRAVQRKEFSALCSWQGTPQLHSLLGLAETPGKHQILFTLWAGQENTGWLGRMGHRLKWCVSQTQSKERPVGYTLGYQVLYWLWTNCQLLQTSTDGLKTTFGLGQSPQGSLWKAKHIWNKE